MRVERLRNNPIVTPEIDARIGSNINGPSLVRVPEWIRDPLGAYYLYFAHHKGQYIRMAFADDLEGPWSTYGPGVLDLENSFFWQLKKPQSCGVARRARGLRQPPDSDVLPRRRGEGNPAFPGGA